MVTTLHSDDPEMTTPQPPFLSKIDVCFFLTQTKEPFLRACEALFKFSSSIKVFWASVVVVWYTLYCALFSLILVSLDFLFWFPGSDADL